MNLPTTLHRFARELWEAAPVPSDSERGALARLFHRLVTSVALVLTVYTPTMLMLGGVWHRVFAPTVVLLGSIIALSLLRVGRVTEAVRAYIWIAWVAIALQSGLQSGLLNPALHATVLMILMGGLLLGFKQALCLWLASLAWGLMLALGVTRGWLAPVAPATGFGYFVACVAVWTIGLAVSALVLRAYRQQVDDVRTLNTALREKVNLLDAQALALSTTEGRLRQLLRASPLPITVAHFERGVYLDVNPAWERTFQRTHADVIGRTSVDIGFWSNQAARAEWLRQFNQDGRVSGFAARFLLPDGQARDFMLSSERFQYGSEECIVTMSVDVTDLRRLEDQLATANERLRGQLERLAQQERTLRESEAKIQQILRANPSPMSIARMSDGTYLDVNAAWEREFQYRRDEVLGRTSADIGLFATPAERQAWADAFDTESRLAGWELNFRARDGSSRHFLVSSEKFQFGDEMAVIAVSIDLTERERLQEELRALNQTLESRVQARTAELARTNEELTATMSLLSRTQDELVHAEKLASLGGLVAGVAHELNTPIGNALLAVTTLADHERIVQAAVADNSLRRSQLNEFLVHTAQTTALALRSLLRANELIVSFKQVAVDQASERRRQFDLKACLHEVIETLQPTLKSTRVSIRIRAPDGIAMDSFPGPLGQVLINLVTNASVHAFAPGQEGQIWIDAERDGPSRVAIHCRDNGVGIPSGIIARVFDPFFTTKFGTGGSGLGLSISHRLVTQVLGGTIDVESPQGQGAHFTVRVPLMAPNAV